MPLGNWVRIGLPILSSNSCLEQDFSKSPHVSLLRPCLIIAPGHSRRQMRLIFIVGRSFALFLRSGLCSKANISLILNLLCSAILYIEHLLLHCTFATTNYYGTQWVTIRDRSLNPWNAGLNLCWIHAQSNSLYSWNFFVFFSLSVALWCGVTTEHSSRKRPSDVCSYPTELPLDIFSYPTD